MKKFFTTLAAFAMVAMAANAEVTVTYNGEELSNGAEITITDKDYENLSYPEYGLFQYSAELVPVIECGDPVQLYAVASNSAIQVCPNGNCIPSKQDGDVWVVNSPIKNSHFDCNIHFIINAETLPVATETLTVTLTDDDDEPFTFTVISKTGDSGVEEILAGVEKVAAIYDMQGHRVRDDFRGVGIVVYDNGKAVKQIIK